MKCISTCNDFFPAETLAKHGKLVAAAEELGIQCLEEDFLSEVQAGGGALLLIKKKAISDWGEDVEKRISKSQSYKSAMSSISSSSTKEKNSEFLIFIILVLK